MITPPRPNPNPSHVLNYLHSATTSCNQIREYPPPNFRILVPLVMILQARTCRRSPKRHTFRRSFLHLHMPHTIILHITSSNPPPEPEPVKIPPQLPNLHMPQPPNPYYHTTSPNPPPEPETTQNSAAVAYTCTCPILSYDKPEPDAGARNGTNFAAVA